jgi:hypothetical protein
MSASASEPHWKSTTRGISHKGKKSEEVDTQNREAGCRVNHDPPIPTEASTVATEDPFMTFFQGSSNVQISNTNFTAIGGDATIIRFGGQYS